MDRLDAATGPLPAVQGRLALDVGTRWWLAHGEQDLPTALDWLSPPEQQLLAGFRYTKRRVEFLTRRWTAKRAVARVLDRDSSAAALAAIEVRHHASGAPWVAVDGQPAAVELSISDRAGWAVCVVGPPGGSGAALGIDLELVEPRSEGFVGDFFTPAEAAAVRQLPAGAARDEAANLVWSAKESALKVLKVGLRADTRSVQVRYARERRPDGWAPLAMAGEDGSAFTGWWRRDGVFLLTTAGRQPAPPPQPLEGGGDLARATPLHSWLQRPLA